MSERPPQHTRDRDPRRRLVRRACALAVPDRWACCVERWTRRPDVAASRLADARFPGTRSVLFRRSRRIHYRRKGYRCIESPGLGSWQRLGVRDGVDSSTADPTRHGRRDRIHITRRWIWRVGQRAQIFASRERKPGALLSATSGPSILGFLIKIIKPVGHYLVDASPQRTQHPTM